MKNSKAVRIKLHVLCIHMLYHVSQNYKRSLSSLLYRYASVANRYKSPLSPLHTPFFFTIFTQSDLYFMCTLRLNFINARISVKFNYVKCKKSFVIDKKGKTYLENVSFTSDFSYRHFDNAFLFYRFFQLTCPSASHVIFKHNVMANQSLPIALRKMVVLS